MLESLHATWSEEKFYIILTFKISLRKVTLLIAAFLNHVSEKPKYFQIGLGIDMIKDEEYQKITKDIAGSRTKSRFTYEMYYGIKLIYDLYVKN